MYLWQCDGRTKCKSFCALKNHTATPGIGLGGRYPMVCVRLLERAGIDAEDISELLLMGEETEYPFVRKHMEKLVGREARSLNTSECVEARGAALSDRMPG